MGVFALTACLTAAAPLAGATNGGSTTAAAEAPLPIVVQDDPRYDEHGDLILGRYRYAGPSRYTHDPIYGDLIYGGTAAPREAAALERPVAFRLGLSVLSVAETDLDDHPGDVDVNRGGGDLGLDIALGAGAGLSLNSAFEVSSYNFDGAGSSSFGTDAPFDTVYIASLSASAWKSFGEDFTGFGTFAFGAGWQEGSEPSDGQTYLVSVGGTARVQDGLHLGLAALAVDRLERNVNYLVYPIIDWRIAPEWRLATAETGLPGVGLFFEPDDRFSIYGAVGVELRQFRTENSGPFANLAVHDERVRLSGGVRWRVGSNIILWTEAGAYPYQQIEAFNNDGQTEAKEELETALFASARLQVTF